MDREHIELEHTLNLFRAEVAKLPPLKIPAKVAMIAEDMYGIKLNEGGGGYEIEDRNLQAGRHSNDKGIPSGDDQRRARGR